MSAVIPHIRRVFGQIVTETPYDSSWVGAIRSCIPQREREYDDNARVWKIDLRHYKTVLLITQHFFGSRVMDSTGGCLDTAQDMSGSERFLKMVENQEPKPEDRKREAKRPRPQRGGFARSVLFVTDDAPPEVITAAWRALAAKYHPDKPGGDASTMQKINAAYQQIKEQGIV